MRGVNVVACVAMLALLTSGAMADAVDLNTKSMNDLLGTGWSAIGSPTSTNMISNTLNVTTISQAFTNGNSYVYLYQIDNAAPAGKSSVELFTVAPFTGADDSTDMGILSGPLVSGFLSDGRAPGAEGYVDPATAGTEISFYFNKLSHEQIAPGQHSEILYIASDLAPDRINGNVIDGSTATGIVVGPIPEPCTMTLIGLGAVGMLIRRRAR